MRKRHSYMSNNSSTDGGAGITTVVQIVFIILKLIGTIDWPWGIVLIPLWIELALILIAIVYLLICYWLD